LRFPPHSTRLAPDDEIGGFLGPTTESFPVRFFFRVNIQNIAMGKTGYSIQYESAIRPYSIGPEIGSKNIQGVGNRNARNPTAGNLSRK